MKRLCKHKFQCIISISHASFKQTIQLFLSRFRHKSDSVESRKQVLVLGAGMVSGPLIEYLYRDEKVSINVCSQIKEEADRLANKFPGIKSTYLDVTDSCNNLAELCRKSDVVISLLPYALHGLVAEKCIQNKTHLVTASTLVHNNSFNYISYINSIKLIIISHDMK